MNSPTRLNRLDFSYMLLLIAGGIVLRLSLLNTSGFDGLYGQDAYAYYDFAGELRTAANEGRAPGAFFWPLGYPALLAIVQALFGPAPTSGQIVNLLMGAALPALAYLLTRLMGSRQAAALAAGLIMAVCGQALQSSIVLMADTPALFWATVSAVALWAYLDNVNNTKRNLFLPLAAFTLALACITRWLYLILIIPWGLVLLIAWRGHIRWRVSVVAFLAAMVVIFPQMVYSRSNPYPTLRHAWVEGWSPANVINQVFDNLDGHFEYSRINAVYYAQPFYEPFYLATVFTPFLLVGGGWLLSAKHYRALLLLLGWALLPYLFLVGIPYQNIRFPLIVFPAVAMMVGIGLEGTAQLIGHGGRRPYVYTALCALVVFGLGQTLFNAQNIIDSFITHQQEDKKAARWAAAVIPQGSRIYTLGLTLTLKHYTSLDVHELYYETPHTLEEKWTAGQDDFLLLNVYNIEHQWAGRDPQFDFHWLRDIRGLIRLGKNGYYTLYRVRG